MGQELCFPLWPEDTCRLSPCDLGHFEEGTLGVETEPPVQFRTRLTSKKPSAPEARAPRAGAPAGSRPSRSREAQSPALQPSGGLARAGCCSHTTTILPPRPEAGEGLEKRGQEGGRLLWALAACRPPGKLARREAGRLARKPARGHGVPGEAWVESVH